MAKGMKKQSMKGAMKKATQPMKSKKTSKKDSKAGAMKKVMKKAKKVSTVGSRLKVWNNVNAKKTRGGLTKDGLKKNKAGRIVAKKSSEAAKKRFSKTIGPWHQAVVKARKALGVTGFVAINSKTNKVGQEVYKKAKEIYSKK